MEKILTTFHITFGMLTVGALFLQSLMMLMQRRLSQTEAQGVKEIQFRIQKFIYYPMLAVTLSLGTWQAWQLGLLTTAKWLHWKLVLVLLLIACGLIIDQQLSAKRYIQPLILAVHILTLILITAVVYLAHYRNL